MIPTSPPPAPRDPVPWADLVGIDYALNGQEGPSGLNCYGLVREVYRYLQIDLPKRSHSRLDDRIIASEAALWERIPEAEPYAVAVIDRGDGYHLAVVTPSMDLLHALDGPGVVLSPLMRYVRRIVAYYRYRPQALGGPVVLPAGDGDVGRAVGGILVAIAAMALAPVTMGGSLFGWSALTGGALYGAIGASMAISLVGNMVVNAIAPLAMPDTAPGTPAELSRNYTWDGIMNEARPGLPKPWIFGKILTGGQIACESTWINSNNKEFYEALICPAKGAITRIHQVYINDTEVENFPAVDVELRHGDDEQSACALFPKISVQYASGAKVPYDESTTAPAKYVQFSSKTKPKGARIILTAPGGIFYMADAAPVAQDVKCVLQYKKKSAGSWTTHASTVYAWRDDEIPHIDRPAKTFTGLANPYYVNDTLLNRGLEAGSLFELVIGATTYYCTVTTITYTRLTFNCYTDSGRSVAKTGSLGYVAYKIQGPDITHATDYTPTPSRIQGFNTDISVKGVFFNLVVPPGTGMYIYNYMKIDVYYKASGGATWILFGSYEFGTKGDSEASASGTQPVEIIFPTAGTYNVRILVADNTCYEPTTYAPQVQSYYADDLVVSDNASYLTIEGDDGNPTAAVSKTVELTGLNPSGTEERYDFRVWRTTKDQTNIYYTDDVYVRGYAEILEVALAYPNHALVAVSIMATDRLSSSRPTIKALVEGGPLSMPSSGYYSTTVASDGGMAGTSDRRIVLCLHGDGSYGSTTITDSSYFQSVVTPHGNAMLSTSYVKLGTASIYLDGSGDWLTIPSRRWFNPGTSDFTIEWWEYRPAGATATGPIFASNNDTVPSMIIASNGNVYMSSNGVSFDIANAKTMGTMGTGAWKHYCVMRKGENFYTFGYDATYDGGVMKATWASTKALAYSEDDIQIGYWKGTYRQCYIDEFTIHNYAKYDPTGYVVGSRVFTPPASAYLAGNIVNGQCVDGCRMITVSQNLTGQSALIFWWLVFASQAGYADSTHLLTKPFVRVLTWEIVSSQTKLYVASSEAISAGTSVYLMNETVGRTDRRAWVVAKLLIEGSNGRITADKLNWTSFAAFDTWCEGSVLAEPGGSTYERRYIFNGAIDYQEDLWSMAHRIAAEARGTIVASGGLYSIMIDKAVTAPAQVFGEGNTANVKIHPIPRNDRANIMVTSYLDADLSYRQKDVSEQDVQSGEYPIVKTIPLLIGCDRETEARRYLRYLIKQNRYVGDMITFDAGPDALEVQVGDVFAFQSQANDFMFSGRIKEVSGSNVIIDQTFTPTGGVTYKWTLWGVNGTVYTRTGTLTGTNIDYLPTPTGFTQTDPYSSPYIITKVSTGETWFRVLKVSRSGKTAHASITGIEYRSEVYTED